MKKVYLLMICILFVGAGLSYSQTNVNPKVNAKIEANKNNPNFNKEKFLEKSKQNELNIQAQKKQGNQPTTVKTNVPVKEAKRNNPVATSLPPVKMTQADYNKLPEGRKQYVNQHPEKFEIIKE